MVRGMAAVFDARGPHLNQRVADPAVDRSVDRRVLQIQFGIAQHWPRAESTQAPAVSIWAVVESLFCCTFAQRAATFRFIRLKSCFRTLSRSCLGA